jgi:hypothetical protein
MSEHSYWTVSATWRQITSAAMAQLAVTPPVVGCVQIET